MSEQCKQTVYSGTWARPHRCQRKATRDGYCKQHHPDTIAERAKKSELIYQKKLENSPYTKLIKAQAEIDRLTAELAKYKDAVTVEGLTFEHAELLDESLRQFNGQRVTVMVMPVGR